MADVDKPKQAELNQPVRINIPSDFTELDELRSISLDHKLGYFGQQPFVVVGYSDRGQEIFWKDGESSGFGLGHWQFFLEALVPLAVKRGFDLGGVGHAGTHVVVLDREQQAAYATCRNCAETFLSHFYGTELPSRKCMCDSARS